MSLVRDMVSWLGWIVMIWFVRIVGVSFSTLCLRLSLVQVGCFGLVALFDLVWLAGSDFLSFCWSAVHKASRTESLIVSVFRPPKCRLILGFAMFC